MTSRRLLATCATALVIFVGSCAGDGGMDTPASGSGGRSGSGGAPGGAGGNKGSGGKTGAGGSAAGGATASTTSSCSTGTSLSGGTQHCSSNAQGNIGSYSWTIWSSGSGGCITPYGVGAAFKATWNNSGDYLARVGLALGSNKTYDQYGTFSADYAETHTGTGGTFSYIGIYGWTVNPLYEWYIVDDWVGSTPNPGTKVGTITVDGAAYDVFTHTQIDQPAITGGNTTFDQRFSVRQTPRQCGHITISDHFKAWAGLGLQLGKLEEAKILVEVGGGSGSADFTTATITVQ